MLRGYNMDAYRVSYHGYAHTHIDALCHILYKDQTYNGYARADVNTEKGCTRLAIDTLKDGVVVRGVLIDIPRLKDVPYLEPGAAVYQEDVEAWEKRAGIKVGAGDAVLLRTGRWARREKVGPWPVGQNAAGFHASIASWLKARDVAFGVHVDHQPAPRHRRYRLATEYAGDVLIAHQRARRPHAIRRVSADRRVRSPCSRIRGARFSAEG